MYHEIEGQHNMPTIVFDEDRLTVGKDTYPYTDLDKIEVLGTPIFATYGILKLTTGGREVSIPYPRSRTQKMKRALREYDRLRERGELPVRSEAPPGPYPGTAADPYEEVKKLKELLDLSIITEEEFQKKKKDLLGL